MRGVLEVHVRGERGGQAADLAPAHGVGLAGDRERPRAGLADAAGGEVAVDDRVDLVGAAADWFTPWLNSVTVRSVPGQSRRRRRGRRRSRPQVGGGAVAVARRAAATAASQAVDVGGDVGGVERAAARRSRRAARSTARRRCRRRSGRCRSASSQVSVRRGIDDHDAASPGAPPWRRRCAGRAPDGTRRRWSRRGPRGRPGRGPRSCRARCPRRRRGCGRRPRRPCRAASWCRCCPSR